MGTDRATFMAGIMTPLTFSSMRYRPIFSVKDKGGLFRQVAEPSVVARAKGTALRWDTRMGIISLDCKSELAITLN